jgi:hypothetical protein
MSEKQLMLTDLELQHQYTDELKCRGDAAFTLVAAEAFIESIRDSGYKSTATAIDEFIDNAMQAGASRIDLVYDPFRERGRGGKTRVGEIAVIDNGHGMGPDMLRAAVMWGGTHRHNDRSGFGRYGFGLPSAAVSVTRCYDVYSLVKGDEWHGIRIDLDEIIDGKLTDGSGRVRPPVPQRRLPPDFVQQYLMEQGLEHDSGTVVVLNHSSANGYFRLTSGFQSAASFAPKMMEHLGLVYRGLLRDHQLYVVGRRVGPVDPLFLDPNARFYDVGNGVFAEGLDPLSFDVKRRSDGKSGMVRLRFSYMPPKFQEGPNGSTNERFRIMKESLAYLIVTRAGRQIDLVTQPAYPSENENVTVVNYDRNWAIELDFDPILDEEFGITVNKQQVALSPSIWERLSQQGVPMVVRMLRSRHKRERNTDTKNVEGLKTLSKLSEQAMRDAEKFAPDANKPLPEAKKKTARTRFEQEVESKTKSTGEKRETVRKQLLDDIRDRPYEVEFEQRPEAPFYRVELLGIQPERIRVFVNTAHRFFTDLYDAPQSTDLIKNALNLLLFVLGRCEIRSIGDREIFYQVERQVSSSRASRGMVKATRRRIPVSQPTRAD